MIILKSERELAAMARSGNIVARAIRAMKDKIAPGIVTRDLDRLAERVIKSEGGIPAFKGYRGFPANICLSLNDEIVHGIPSKRRLSAGDIVSIDVGVLYEGFCADAAFTVAVGKVSEQAQRLMKAADEALMRGIEAAVAGNRVGDISAAIQGCAESYGFDVIREYVGHGIGRNMHEDPQVPNYGSPRTGIVLESGMTLAIEPMLVCGNWPVKVDDDQWTVRTLDGELSAHSEHTVAITDDGPVILTCDDREAK